MIHESLVANFVLTFVKDLFNYNNVKIELIKRLILRRKEIHADKLTVELKIVFCQTLLKCVKIFL